MVTPCKIRRLRKLNRFDTFSLNNSCDNLFLEEIGKGIFSMMNRGLRNKIFSIFTVTLLSCLVFSGCGQSGNGGNKGNDGNINSAEISDFEELTGIKETTEPDTEGPFYKIEYEVIAENAAPVLPEDFDYEPEEEEYRYASAPVSYGNILTEPYNIFSSYSEMNIAY